MQLFLNFKSENLGEVYVADGNVVEIMGRVEESLKLINGKLKKTSYPFVNSTSPASMVVFDSAFWKISKGARILAMCGTLHTTGNTSKVAEKVSCDTRKKRCRGVGILLVVGH